MVPERVDTLVGSMLGKDYRVIQPIGTGGMAVVYFAQRGQFDPFWMLSNLALLLFPLPLLTRLSRIGQYTHGSVTSPNREGVSM